jgi:hypothetical protein
VLFEPSSSHKKKPYKMSTPLIDIPIDWDPQAKQQQRAALADFSAAPWQGFEKSERGPNNSSLFQPQAAVVVVALG